LEYGKCGDSPAEIIDEFGNVQCSPKHRNTESSLRCPEIRVKGAVANSRHRAPNQRLFQRGQVHKPCGLPAGEAEIAIVRRAAVLAARALLAGGLADPSDTLVMRHAGSEYDALRARIGVAASAGGDDGRQAAV
jgi:hypothetical protein